MKEKTHSLVVRLSRFAREFTDGLDRREFGRLFEQDTARAIAVLSGDRLTRLERKGDLKRLLLQVRSFFVGLAFQLSPARRMLFAAALAFPILGLLTLDTTLVLSPLHVAFDFSPLWFVLSIASLTLLLALELVDRLRVRDELEVARQLQRDLLPRQTPHLAGWSIAHSYRTANEIGGDYYEFLPLPDGRLAVAVGDASGHGMAAGLLMAIANASLKTALDLDPEPLAVLQLLNRVLLRTGDRRAFMTLFYAILDPASGELEYASAGHPFPILRRTNGEVRELGQGALPLGLRTEVTFVRERVVLEPGDLLVLYSDGLPEALGEDGEFAFGFDRLQSLAGRAGEPLQIHDNILAALDRHIGDRPLEDDLTLVALSRRMPPSSVKSPSLPPPSLPPPSLPPPPGTTLPPGLPDRDS